MLSTSLFQRFAQSETEPSSKVHFGLDSCLEVLFRECSAPTAKAVTVIEGPVLKYQGPGTIPTCSRCF